MARHTWWVCPCVETEGKLDAGMQIIGGGLYNHKREWHEDDTETGAGKISLKQI